MSHTEPPEEPAQPRTRREARQAREAREAAQQRPAESEPAEPDASAGQRDAGHPTGGASDRGGHDHFAWRLESYPDREPRRWNHKRIWSTVIVLAVIAAMVVAVIVILQPVVSALTAKPGTTDYSGNGHGEVVVKIVSGDTGQDVANTLEKDGVVKTSGAFYDLLLSKHPAPVFHPGAYRLAKQMSAKAALSALLKPDNKLANTAVIPEGTTEKNILEIVAKSTKISLADLQAAAKNPAAYGVPPQAKTLEGFLFPATYTFDPGTTAQQVLKTMVDRMFQSLDAAGVAPDDRYRVVTFASLVQKEGKPGDFAKVARVFQNRLDQGMLLQSDATVTYWTGKTDRATTTDAEREDASNPYNTYVHPGLPVGPIGNPGDKAIEAVMHPADGPWLYFVTVNLETGETVFSATFAEHEKAVSRLQQWLKDHPGYG